MSLSKNIKQEKGFFFFFEHQKIKEINQRKSYLQVLQNRPFSHFSPENRTPTTVVLYA